MIRRTDRCWPTRRSSFVRFAAIAAATTAIATSAAAVTIELPGDANRTKVAYSCRASEKADPTSLDVEYVNLPNSSLAVVPLDGVPTLFVNVIAASGAKYVSGRTVWWTKGPGARLYDATAEDMTGATICKVKR